LSNEEVKERLLSTDWVMLAAFLSPCLLFLHLLLVHSEVNVEKTKCNQNKGNEEVYNFEGQISLGIQVIPLLLVFGGIKV
jgi:hypothetical protein